LGSSAIVLDGSIWVIGGNDQANTDAIDIFEPANFTWQRSTPLPAAVGGSFTATVQRRIYIIGGYPVRGGQLVGLSTVLAFDAAAGTWTPKSPLAQRRFFAAGAVLDGRIYVVGGHTNCDPTDSCFEAPLTSLEIYDPAADRWTAGPPMSDARGNAGAAVLNGKLYVAGGTNGLYLYDGAIATVEMFDPQSNGWSRMASLPVSGHIRLVTTNNKLYAVVTWWQVPFARIYEYDPVRDAWTRLHNAPVAGFEAAVVANNGQLYIIGGFQVSPVWQISSSVYVMRR
jgi:N-acetylneuraminic acid mutarotase